MLEKAHYSQLLVEKGSKRNGRQCAVAIVSNHVPTRCGIASFTSDLADGLEGQGNDVSIFAVADRSGQQNYPRRVRSEIDRNDVASYLNGARAIERDGYDVICLQHEYGIYGGESGSHILTLLKNVTKPVITTLHTILEKPSAEQKKVMQEIVERSTRIVVMSARGREILQSVHPDSVGKIDIIPHGVPDGSMIDRRQVRRALGLSHRKVILTFGLISKDKGIEEMITAMDRVRREVPEALYVVVGATHPNVLLHEGETYRDSLITLVSELDLQDHVLFVNEFVPQEKLVEWIVACDAYVCPYLKTEQITSGTLSYAFGFGKPIVSTPNWHAQELLAEGGGKLVPVRDPEAISEALIPILRRGEEVRSDEEQLKLDQMQWRNTAGTYASVFKSTRRKSLPLFEQNAIPLGTARLPRVNLSHLLNLTDDVGVIQHAQFSLPRRSEGYCTDDNARGLILALQLEPEAETQRLERIYLSFVAHAFDSEKRAFHNFMGYDRTWLDSVGSDDCQGRAVWSLGTVALHSRARGHQQFADDWFYHSASLCTSLRSLRARAYCLLGLSAALQSGRNERVREIAEQVAQGLVDEYRQVWDQDWPWLESVLTYDNARLPHALLISAALLRRAEVQSDALASLRWLCKIQTDDSSNFAPIGCNGFYPKGGNRAWFDQQPIEATATVDACIAAYRVTGDSAWMFEARRALDWFTGRNRLGQILVTEEGGSFDGLMADAVNQNQGAESTLCYLSALNTMRTTMTDLSLASGSAVVV